MSAAAEYLPPLVQQLKGDASDLLAAYGEAEAAMKAFGKSSGRMGDEVAASSKKSGQAVSDFDELVVRKMRQGESAVAALKREMLQAERQVQTLRKEMDKGGGDFKVLNKAIEDLKRLKKIAQDVAPDLAQNMGREVATGISSMGSMIVPAIIGLVVLASPAIAAAIGGAVAIGLGLGFAGIGAILAATLLPKVQKAFTTLGGQIKKTMTWALSGKFDDQLIAAVKRFQAYLPGIGKQLRQIFDQVAPFLKPLADAFGTGLSKFLTGAGQALANSGPAIQAFIDELPSLMGSLGTFLADITKDGPALVRFITDASDAFSSFMDGAGATIAWLEGAYLWLAKLHDKAVAGGWDTPWHAVQTGAKAAWDWIKKAAKAVGDWAKGVGKAVSDWVGGVVDWFKGLPGRIRAFVARLPGILSEAWRKLLYDVGFALGRAVLFFQELPGRAETFLKDLWQKATTWVSATWRSVVDWFKRTKDDVIAWIKKAVDGAIEWFQKLPGRAEEKAKELKDKIINFFQKAPDWLYNAGKDLITGLVNGVKDALNWAVEKVKGAANSIASGFKDALGIHSPSTVFAGFGADTVAGYVQGLTRSMPAVQAVWSRLNGMTPQPAYAGSPGVTPAIAAGMQGRPTVYAAGGGGYVPIVVELGGSRMASVQAKLIPAAQRYGMRTATTGLGAVVTKGGR